jgi:hypothetical protein
MLCGWLHAGAWACSPCRASVQAGIFDSAFAVRLGLIVLPVLLMAALAGWLWHVGEKEAEPAALGRPEQARTPVHGAEVTQ